MHKKRQPPRLCSWEGDCLISGATNWKKRENSVAPNNMSILEKRAIINNNKRLLLYKHYDFY